MREAGSFQVMSCLIDDLVMAKSVCTCLFLSRKGLYGLISANKKVIVCKFSKETKTCRKRRREIIFVSTLRISQFHT